MLIPKRHQPTVAFLALLGAFVFAPLFGVVSSDQFQYCEAHNGQYPSAQNDKDKSPAFPIAEHDWFGRLWACGGGYANENGSAITAVATYLLGLVTAILGWIAFLQFTTTRAELRAYLSVVIWQAAYQETQRNIRFAATPKILNRGKTPAYNVRTWSRAEIIPDNVIAGYVFSIVPGNEQSQASIGPDEERILNTAVPNLVADADIAPIKLGNQGRSLWTWGTIKYDDVFGRPHYVNYCQRLFWIPDHGVMGQYSDRFADSD